MFFALGSIAGAGLAAFGTFKKTCTSLYVLMPSSHLCYGNSDIWRRKSTRQLAHLYEDRLGQRHHRQPSTA